MGLKLNVGCGPVQPAGWINVDNSNRAKLAKRAWWLDRFLVRLGAIPPTEFGPQITVANLLKRWPFPDNSCDAVYAGEVWEHFTESQAEFITLEAFRVLRPGGTIRLRTPDGVQFWKNYLDAVNVAQAAPVGERAAAIERIKSIVRMYFREICTKRVWLDSIGHFHKWQWDEVLLTDLLRRCGFAEVQRMPYRQSRIADVSLVEHWDMLMVEGVKPSSS